MPSPTEIVNLALDYIAEEPITDLTADTSKRAKRAARFFWPTADECLADHPWRFATLWSPALAVSATRLASPKWAFYFALPTEPFCLVVRDTDLGRQPGLWEREGQFVGTDSSSLKVKYTARITDTGLWAPHFVTAYSYLLASKLAFGTSKAANLSDMMLKVYESRLSRARGVNGLEGPADIIVTRTLTDVR